jgi:hypothetical protein
MEGNMVDFHSLLKDHVGLVSALRAIQPSDKERDALGELYATASGFLVTRDAGNRVRGETIYQCSKIGGYLTAHFGGVGATDSMMWIGYIKPDEADAEHWVMRPEIRAALKSLGRF